MGSRPDHPNTCNWLFDNYDRPCTKGCSMDPMAGWESWDPDCPVHGWEAMNAHYDACEQARENRKEVVRKLGLSDDWEGAVGGVVSFLWNTPSKKRQKLLVMLVAMDDKGLWSLLHEPQKSGGS